MKETIARLKAIIEMIENGEIEGESLIEINSFIDSIITIKENTHLKIESEISLSYREELENLDKSLLLKKIEVNKILLNQKKEEFLTQFDQDKYEAEKCVQLLSINECVLENLQDFKSDKIEEKLLFSHWKIEPKDFLIDFKTNNKVWDYASTFDNDNINDILSLGLDVPDDFNGVLWNLKEPQLSIVETLNRQPFKKQIIVFFVNRNNIYYTSDIQCNHPTFNETKDIKFFKAILIKLRLSKMLLRLPPKKLDKQLVKVSKMFNKLLNQKSKGSL